MECKTGLDLLLDNVDNGYWWRLFNLKGMKLKLKEPISEFSHPGFKGDRNYIIIHSYVANPSIWSYNQINAACKINQPIHTYSDNVLYRNELTPAATHNMIHLSLLDFDYFYKLLTNV